MTASADGTARLSDCEGKPLATFVGHTGRVTSTVFCTQRQLHPDHLRLTIRRCFTQQRQLSADSNSRASMTDHYLSKSVGSWSCGQKGNCRAGRGARSRKDPASAEAALVVIAQLVEVESRGECTPLSMWRVCGHRVTTRGRRGLGLADRSLRCLYELRACGLAPRGGY
jgi:hypothetical protein